MLVPLVSTYSTQPTLVISPPCHVTVLQLLRVEDVRLLSRERHTADSQHLRVSWGNFYIYTTNFKINYYSCILVYMFRLRKYL